MPKSIENTVFVRLVPAPAYKVKRHELEDIFSQIGPVKKSSWINAKQPQQKHGKDGGEGDDDNNNDDYKSTNSKGYGFVKYLSQQDAESAANELNSTKVQMDGKMFTLKVELASTTATPSPSKSNKKDEKSVEEPAADRQREQHQGQGGQEAEVDETALLKKKSRIIVRNLSFYAKEQNIRKVMETKFGKVLDVHLPRVKDNLHVGFAFVTFQDPKDAQSAVDSKNIDISKRTVKMDWSLPKSVHQQQKQQQQKQKQQKEEEEEEENMDGDEAQDDDSSSSSSDSDGSDESNSSSSGSNNDDDDDDDDDGSDDDEAMEEHDESDDDDEEEEQHDDAVEKKCTLFLRNLPFDVTRNDVFQVLYRFGYINGIYLVKDRDTGMPKGTAFVTFSKPQSAQRAIDFAVTEGDGEFVSQREGTKKLTGGESGGSLMIKDRRVFVNLAVDKETAATFDSKDDKIPSADRRNLYLQAESRVESSSTDPGANNADTWDEIPVQDQKRRQTALKDKTTKLQSPIFFINPNRLSFRNIAKHVDEAELQKMVEVAVKRGLEKGLVSAKDQIAHMRALGEMSTRDILAKIQDMERNNEEIIPSWMNGDVDSHRQFKYNIPSVYIARDFGPNGKKKDAPSRGFGFAEFRHHTHALACLRELNNNPLYSREYVAGGKAADGLKKRVKKNKKPTSGGSDGGSDNNDFVGDDGRVRVPRLIVDFTVENKVKAKKQAERRLNQEMNRTKQHLENKEKKIMAAQDGEDTPKKRGRGAIQREKKRLRRESGEEEKERQEKLEAKALAEARKEMRKERQAQRQKQKEEQSKKKTVKPPKKKKRMDEEDERFDDIVRTYTSKLETVRKQPDEKNPRAVVKEKRWFE
mmetsp:Transcript_20660/g.49024  ORF Transcript_20660/g.49024 Transcript_20660/m.49024 type:complete len:864 (-) Transcript_20660:76-2667(-)